MLDEETNKRKDIDMSSYKENFTKINCHFQSFNASITSERTITNERN